MRRRTLLGTTAAAAGLSGFGNWNAQAKSVIESSADGRMQVFWGQSYESYDAAVAAAEDAAKEALAGKTLEWLEVVEFRGGFDEGRLQYQTSVRVGYA